MATDHIPDRARLGHLLWELGARVGLQSEVALSRTALTARAAGFLKAVSSDPGVSITEISHQLPVSPQAISKAMARLENAGCIERHPGGRGRSVALFVIATGARDLAEADECMEAFDRALTAALGETRHAELVRLLTAARPIFNALHRGV